MVARSMSIPRILTGINEPILGFQHHEPYLQAKLRASRARPQPFMKRPALPASLEEEAREMLQVLELHWHRRYQPEEIRQKVVDLLERLRQVLSRDSADARFVASTYRRLLRHEALEEEVELANQVLKRMVAELSVVVVSVLPFAFITLPGLLALARHFGIELFPPAETKSP